MEKRDDIWYAVVNPNAGSGKTLSLWRKAEGMLFEKGIRYKFVTPETSADSQKRIKAACRAGYRKFIAVGGDGTAHNLVRGIVEYVQENAALEKDAPVVLDDFSVAVLPIGSGNDWIRSHNIPHDHALIVDMMSRGEFRAQDIVKAEILDAPGGKAVKTAYMINIGGYAFDANVCDVVNFQKANGVTGKLLYVKALRSLAAKQKARRAKVLCDGKTVFDDRLYSISFGNGRFSGGGLCQTPSAVMDDGLLDIMIAPKFPLWKLITGVRKLLNGKVETLRFLTFAKASVVEVIPGEGLGELVEMDGEIIGRAPLRLSFLSGRLNVLHKDI